MTRAGGRWAGRGIAVAVVLALALLTMPAAAQPGPEVTNRPDCGLNEDPAPDCALEDMNPTSPTFGQTVHLSDYDDKVVFVMFMRASCGHCQSLVGPLQAMLEAHQGSWGDDVVILVVNMIGWEAEIPYFTSLSDLPVLQDTAAEYYADRIGASLYSNYVLRTGRDFHCMHYDLSMPTNEARLIAEIEAALGSKKR